MATLESLLPTLVRIEANLDDNLSLARMAAFAGYSPYHFQRIFREAIGETPRAYVTRLRIERAAARLLFHAGTILTIAQEVGFERPETFGRAFRRRFGVSPSAFRAEWRSGRTVANAQLERIDEGTTALSGTRLVSLTDTHLAFIRHLGPYEAVPTSLFAELLAWRQRRAEPGPPVLFGIGHDAPSTTTPEQLRFDACVLMAGAFPAEGRIGHQLLEGGSMALTTHAGPLDSLPTAYATVFARLFAMRGITVIGLPVIEVYHSTPLDTARAIVSTDIYIPISRGGY